MDIAILLYMKQTIKLLKAISDPTRFKLFKLIQHRASCVCELTAAIGLAQPTVSRHLKQLEEAGLVQSKRSDNTWIVYSVTSDPSKETSEMLPIITQWHEDSKEITALRNKLDHIAQLRSLKVAFGLKEKSLTPNISNPADQTVTTDFPTENQLEININNNEST